MRPAYTRAASWLGLALLGAVPSYAKQPAATGTRSEARASTALGETPHRAPPAAEAAATPGRSAAVPEPPPADLTEQAKQLYLLGAEAFTAQRNADAIYCFRQAERLVPSAKLTYNIALAYDEMGDTGRALREYRAFLVREPHSVHREEAQARIAKLELALAALGLQQLSVISDPPGATLQVGTEVVGITPWSGELTPGLHRIRLEHQGYQAHDADVALSAAHAADVQVALLSQPASAERQPSALQRIQPLSWSFLGVGVGAIGGGLGFALSQAASSDQASHASTPEAAAHAQGAADAKQMASLALLGAGGAFVISGAVLLVLDLNRATSVPGATSTAAAAPLSLPCARDFCGLVTQGQF
jgi:hypothetical protein